MRQVISQCSRKLSDCGTLWMTLLSEAVQPNMLRVLTLTLQ